MTELEMLRAVVERMASTVSLLCTETASLVDYRALGAQQDDKQGIRGRADELREAGRLLDQALGKVL